MIQCVIFDNDGTLVDSELLAFTAMQTLLKQHGVHESANDLHAQFPGVRLAEILTYLEQKHNVELGVDFVPQFRQDMTKLFETQLKPMNGVAEALSKIHLPMCVASSGTMAKIEHTLTITGLRPFFKDRLYSGYDLDVWKPDPGIFLHAAEQMGFAPKNCAVVEDSIVGIQAALAANTQPILYDPNYKHQPMRGVTTIHHMHELDSLFETSA